MKKTFKMENLDCAHCAAKMEDAIKKIFRRQKMRDDENHRRNRYLRYFLLLCFTHKILHAPSTFWQAFFA